MNSKIPCPVCGSQHTSSFLSRNKVPVHQNYPLNDSISAKNVERGNIDLFVCLKCEFIFNNSFDSSKMQYSSDYDNTQTHSPFFNDYMDELIDNVLLKGSREVCTVLEVGCGKGDFLERLVTKAPNIKAYGFDPSYNYNGVNSDRIVFIKDFYDERYENISADIVLCRHVIEHVPDPVGLLRIIRRALASSPGAKLFFETPCVDWILSNQVIYDFFYEHCSYFTKNSLTNAFELAEFQVERVCHVFSGQYLWLEASVSGKPCNSLPTNSSGKRINELAKRFTQKEIELLNQWKVRLQQLAQQGPVVLWGAGAKGVTFANLLDSEYKHIRCIVDVNPNKQGRFLPGTGHPIVNPQSALFDGMCTVIIVNPNYKEEIENLLRHFEVNPTLVLFNLEHSIN